MAEKKTVERRIRVPESEVTFWDRVELLENAIEKVRTEGGVRRGKAALGLINEAFAFAHAYMTGAPEYDPVDKLKVKRVRRDSEGNITNVIERMEPGLAQVTYSIDYKKLNDEGTREQKG